MGLIIIDTAGQPFVIRVVGVFLLPNLVDKVRIAIGPCIDSE